MRWLALDVGRKRVGMALCDAEESVVVPKATLDFVSGQNLAARVKVFVEQWNVEGVVVGWPQTRLGRSPGEFRVRAVLAALAEVLPIPVVPFDESGTTLEAASRLAEGGLSSRKAKDVIDAVAAAVLLETFLAQRKREDPPCPG
ncbi:MAG: Holliday junction resolvase RuvX [Thermoanaerobaculaceae bacterium]